MLEGKGSCKWKCQEILNYAVLNATVGIQSGPQQDLAEQ